MKTILRPISSCGAGLRLTGSESTILEEPDPNCCAVMHRQNHTERRVTERLNGQQIDSIVLYAAQLELDPPPVRWVLHQLHTFSTSCLAVLYKPMVPLLENIPAVFCCFKPLRFSNLNPLFPDGLVHGVTRSKHSERSVP